MLHLPSDFLTYTILLIVFALFQGSLILILVYLFVDKVLISKKDTLDNDIVKQEAYDKALNVLEDAKEKSLEILGTSNDRARKILDSVDYINVETKKELDLELKKLSERQVSTFENLSSDLINVYKNSLEDQHKVGLAQIEKTSEFVQEELKNQITDLKDSLQKETAQSEEQVRAMISSDYEHTKSEIEKYKNEKFAEINLKVYELIPQITKEILGRTLTIDDHQSVVLKILDDAKRDSSLNI